MADIVMGGAGLEGEKAHRTNVEGKLAIGREKKEKADGFFKAGDYQNGEAAFTLRQLGRVAYYFLDCS